MVRIVAISDTHLKNPELPEGDLLIGAGDYLNSGSIQDLVIFSSYINSQLHKYKYGSVIVPGNHDLMFESSLPLVKELLPKHRILIDEEVCINGLRIYGTPWVPYINGIWAFEENYHSNRFEVVRDKIPEGLDILISHSPPRGILSKGWGCNTLKERLEQMERPPKIVICGHIHECGGQKHIDNRGIIYYNVAICDEAYRMKNSPTIIDIS